MMNVRGVVAQSQMIQAMTLVSNKMLEDYQRVDWDKNRAH